jgi:hypothetical protein
MADLDRIQRWMQTVIMHPGGVAEGIASSVARQHLNVGPALVEQVITPSRALTAMDRLSIYSSAYYARLLDCLREEFPVLVHALGEEIFDAFALDYLEKYPSQSYTLNDLATRFPVYLAETRPAKDNDDSPGTEWPDFLIDLATLELTFNQIFDGPGVEAEGVLDTAKLDGIGPEQWPEARLVPAPCLRLLRLRYPVHEYYSAVRRNLDPPPPNPADTLLAITRCNYVVRHYSLCRPEFDVLQALMAGQPVAEAIYLAAQTLDMELDHLAANIRRWFQSWTANGFFRRAKVAD